MVELTYQTINVRFQGPICRIQLCQADSENAITNQLVTEFTNVLGICENRTRENSQAVCIVVIEGLPDVFCTGADFRHIVEQNDAAGRVDAERLYHLWMQLAIASFVTIAHVRGRVRAGGVGFVAACDIVLADESATFALSELMFGVFPACVLPFLVRKVGVQKSHYMTLTTMPISVQDASASGLVDAYSEDSESLLRKHLIRLSRLSNSAVSEYKKYMHQLNDILMRSRSLAVSTNEQLFSSQENLDKIRRYVNEGKFPWEP
ncbi:MAG: enoyl-CoA hydratase/isomerase [Nostoc sp. GBBB01]|nr:enoyl-CoA hydratase/isomerase [Nostoc sp. GBBB01]